MSNRTEPAAEALHEPRGQGPNTGVSEEPRDRWLLGELANGISPVSATYQGDAAADLYERELEMYKAILDENLAKHGISILQPESIYRPPVWFNAQVLFIDYPNTTASRSSWSTYTSSEESEADEFFDYDAYQRQLNFQYYRDKDWFRCMVTSFWGPQVASVFEVMHFNRPCIQIAFKRSWDYATEHKKYYANVTMFAHIMSRLPLAGGPGSITDVFGFRIVNFIGLIMSDFETIDRAGVDVADVPSGADTTAETKHLIMRHRFEPHRSAFIKILD